ncbi:MULTISPECIES: helix-turn-helix domain-containing protein [unclassified Paenibacillus]|uniref:helix-turn-helix domain-containing protein n=1 Tax=unclassified Paenibacillus TaxID=185978 RepID=UPI0030F55626
MAIKGQKFKTYSDEIKKEAIRLHVEERWTYRKITEHFEIQDQGRVKKWMKKYRELGEFGLLDQRGRREEYIDQDRYVQKLKRENEMLKKCLEIWMQEVRRTNIVSLRAPQKSMPSETYVNSLGSPEVDTTLS